MKSFIPPFLRKDQQDESLQKLQYEAREQEHLEFLRQESANLRANQISVANTLKKLVEDRYAGHVALGGLRRVNPYRLPHVVGCSVFPENDESGVNRINIDIANDHSFVAVEACLAKERENFMYVHDKEHDQAFLKQGDARLPLSHPLAVDGLRRFKTVCEVLGVTSLATT